MAIHLLGKWEETENLEETYRDTGRAQKRHIDQSRA